LWVSTSSPECPHQQLQQQQQHQLDDVPRAVRVGLLGTAGISVFAVVLPARARPCEATVVSVASRTPGKAEAFANKHGIPRFETSYDDLISAEDIDTIYIALPTKHHFFWVSRCITAGKHVLVEKPVASNADEALVLVESARERGVVLFEGYHYRYHPVAMRLQDVLASGGVGKVERVDVRFSLPSIASWWAAMTSGVLGSGDARPLLDPDEEEHLRYKMLDRWCYCIDTAVWIASTIDPARTLSVVNASALHGRFDAVLVASSSVSEEYHVTAVKDELHVPQWDVSVKGDKGTVRVVNIGFPFLYHRIVANESNTATLYGNGEKRASRQ